MEKFARGFFSVRMMAMGMLVFLLAIAFATFLETKFDTQTAKIIVYNAGWFTALLVYLTFNLIANIFRFRMFQREKISILMFHLAFIVMLIGAGVTRYISFEGMMEIDEGQEKKHIFTADPYFWFKANDGKMQYEWDQKAFMSEITNNYFDHEFKLPGHKPVTIEYVKYRKNYMDSLVTNKSFKENTLEIVTERMKSNYVSEGAFLMIGEVALSYQKKDAMPGIEIVRKGSKLLMKTKYPIDFLAMSEMQRAAKEGFAADSLYQKVPIDTLVPLQMATLYRVGEQQFVLKSIRKHSKMMKVKAPKDNMGFDYLTVKIVDGKDSKLVELEGGAGAMPTRAMVQFKGLVYEMEYGAKPIELPFSIKCRDFQLERYVGSNQPSSFASEVTVIDDKNGVKFDKRIFMNNVMVYGGYRFFQSGYKPDESGTILSVSHDWWGTNISYLGYLMMGIGMVLSLLSPVGRFRELNRLIKKTREKRDQITYVVTALILSTSLSYAQVQPENVNALDTIEHSDHDGHDHSGHDHSGHNHAVQDSTGQTQEIQQPEMTMDYSVMSKEHSDELASLLVMRERVLPLHSFCDQLLRKISRSNKFEDFNAVQTIMSMQMYPRYWSEVDLIYVSSKGGVREKLKMEGSHISFNKLVSEEGHFIFAKEREKAFQTAESKRNEFDKQVIKLGEKVEVTWMIIAADLQLLTILPNPEKPSSKWIELRQADTKSEGFKLAVGYLSLLHEASTKNQSYKEATAKLNELKKFQRKYGDKKVMPSESLVEMEISYNKMNIFKNAMYMYLLLGVFILIVFLIRVFIQSSDRAKLVFKRIGQGLTLITVVAFLYHGYGIYMRWRISGHAPWSDGYEAVVFIGWITMLTGLIFSRKNIAIVAGAALLAFFMLFVTEMNLMDPQITDLEPVLKSYWLMIHVAIITASYGPLGIACILGFMNLLLYVFRGKKTGKIIGYDIDELTYVAEMTMTIGLILLAIGTFLGGIWANESWGRYWGWDPKETWALVAILVYAIILHFRYIPSLKDKFTFNVFSFWAYTSILFTFFGVNFYLVGLHSYANGEGLGEIPDWIIYFMAAMYVFTELASLRNQMYITNGKVTIGYYKKKLILLLGFVIFVAFMLVVLKVSEVGVMIVPILKIIALVLVVNALQYGFTYLSANKNSEQELDQI